MTLRVTTTDNSGLGLETHTGDGGAEALVRAGAGRVRVGRARDLDVRGTSTRLFPRGGGLLLLLLGLLEGRLCGDGAALAVLRLPPVRVFPAVLRRQTLLGVIQDEIGDAVDERERYGTVEEGVEVDWLRLKFEKGKRF